MPHIFIALLVQVVGMVLLGFTAPVAWAAALAGIAVCFMREVTQAEYRWIEANGGLRSAMPWWKGLDVRLWDRHSIDGVAVPALGVAIVALAVTVLS